MITKYLQDSDSKAKSRKDWLRLKLERPEAYAEYLRKRRQARSGNPDYLRLRREARARLKLEKPEKYSEILRKAAERSKMVRQDPKWKEENRCKRRDYFRQWMKGWRKRNADSLSAYRREYRQKNRARITEQNKASKYKKPEKYRAIASMACKKWRAANPEIYLALLHARRSRQMKAGGRYTATEIQELFEKQLGRCANPACHKEITLRTCHRDHKQPVRLGGSSNISNIQLLCKTCNLSKHDKSFEQWCAEVGIATA